MFGLELKIAFCFRELQGTRQFLERLVTKGITRRNRSLVVKASFQKRIQKRPFRFLGVLVSPNMIRSYHGKFVVRSVPIHQQRQIMIMMMMMMMMWIAAFGGGGGGCIDLVHPSMINSFGKTIALQQDKWIYYQDRTIRRSPLDKANLSKPFRQFLRNSFTIAIHGFLADHCWLLYCLYCTVLYCTE